MQYQIKSQLAEATITAKSAKEQIEIVQEQIESMTIRAPQDGIITTWEVKKNLHGPPGRDRPRAAARSPPSATIPTGCSKSRFPTTTWARCWPPRASSRKTSPPARSSPATPLQAYFVTATDPEHRYEGYVRRIAAKAETGRAEARRKVTVGFDEAVRRDFLSRNQELQPGVRSPRSDRLRRDPPGLLPAPQGRPGLVRVGPVPLAVPATLSHEPIRGRSPVQKIEGDGAPSYGSENASCKNNSSAAGRNRENTSSDLEAWRLVRPCPPSRLPRPGRGAADNTFRGHVRPERPGPAAPGNRVPPWSSTSWPRSTGSRNPTSPRSAKG